MHAEDGEGLSSHYGQGSTHCRDTPPHRFLGSGLQSSERRGRTRRLHFETRSQDRSLGQPGAHQKEEGTIVGLL